jgi:hypothetical protein
LDDTIEVHATTSKLDPQNKLDLSRRARVSRRKTRVRDAAEIRTADDALGLPEIRLIEAVGAR